MTRADLALDILQQALLVALQLSLPILLVMLLVGIAVSLIQALTHLQDPTLTFVPKILAVAMAMLLLMPLLLGWATNFTREMIQASATALGGG
ncbi:MAG: flagellar biosynthetic protein FliQ [Planctomycetota bacterium]|jgi:flagellar biosynthetic protein FliQ|nr:flagellar biosynthetic protein FliQ [Planctomycetota bacterium]